MADRGALLAYVPRLLVEWAAERPAATWSELDGTLVFVDISGFTRLSERLARVGGRAGAEELTIVLDDTFGELLTVAAGYGGSMLKFGGDAILLFFWHDGHERRGVAAAAEMRTRLRRRPPVETPAGRVRLQMSVGVHSGIFQMFLVGADHRELVVAGPAATSTVAMESLATAGQIVVSRATAAAVPSALLGREVGDGVLVRNTLRPPEPVEPIAVDDQIDPAPFVPTVLRRHLAAGDHQPEHRHVAVGFTHVVGVDRLINRSGVEETARALDTLMQTTQAVLTEHDVCFLSSDVYDDGFKFITTAGAPNVSEDDPERLLRALRRIHDTRSPAPLTLRSGAHVGHVFAGDVGSSARRAYTVMGDAVNTAARVMAHARPGQLLATPALLDRSQVVFESSPVTPFRAKGKAQPVLASAVGHPRGRRIREDAEPPFTGRAAEVAVLTRAVTRLEAEGAAFTIVAPAGAGKTRLVRKICSYAEGCGVAVVSSSADRYGRTTPFSAARPLLLAATGFGADRPDLARLADAIESSVAGDPIAAALLAGVVGVDVPRPPELDQLEPAAARHRLGRAVVAFVRRWRSTPTVFVLEDAYWADDGSLDVVDALAAQAATEPWLVLTTTRPFEPQTVEGRSATVMELGPLPDADIAAVAGSLVPGGLLPSQATEIAARAAGNPLFAEELARAVSGGRDIDELPDTIEGVVGAEIDRLSPSHRNLVRYAAVVGRSFEPSLVADATSTHFGTNWWRDMPRILVEDRGGTVSFRHPLFRDTAYGGLPYRSRRQMHARIGAALEQRGADSALLSSHFHAAGDWERTWRYAVDAGNDAAKRFANAAAVTLFGHAIDASARLSDIPAEDRVDVYEQLALVIDRVGDYERARQSYRAARKLTDDPVVTARLLFGEGQMRERVARFTEALSLYTRGLRTIAARHDVPAIKQRARLLLARAQIAMHRFDFKQAIRLSEEAEVLATTVDDEPALAQAHCCLYGAHLNLRTPGREKYRDVPLRVYEEHGFALGLLAILNMAAADDYMTGDWAAALRGYERCRALADESGYVQRRGEASLNAGELLADQGRWEEARERLDEAMACFVPAGHRRYMTFGRIQLARTMAAAGAAADAVQLLDDTAAELHALGVRPWELLARARRVEIDASTQPRPAPSVVEAAVAIDREAEGVAGAEQARAIATRAAAVAAGRIGNGPQAKELFDIAVARARAAGSRYEWAITLDLWCGLAGRVAGEPPAAPEDVTAALRHFGVVDHLLRRVVVPT